MSPKHSTHQEVANLAYLNWQKDGSPHGCDQVYWFEAEQQIKHTKHLLLPDTRQQPNGTATATAPKKPKAPRKKTVMA